MHFRILYIFKILIKAPYLSKFPGRSALVGTLVSQLA